VLDGEEAVIELRGLRQSIDNIDAAMIYMLAERFRCTKRVGLLKAAQNLSPGDPQREAYQIERLRQLATILRSRENPKIGWRVDPDLSGVSEVRSFRVLTWTEYSADLDPDFAAKYLAFVIREVIRHHEAFPRSPAL
jgi:chorismate mutase